jgi:DHA3 family macrolide efflux protein-like MFS transporter
MKTNWKKNTALFLTSQTLSLFGTMLVQYAIMWHIVLKTQSGTMMTIYVLVAVLPTFFTSLLGGVWADRYNKKYLINLADGSIALISLAIAINLSAGIDSIAMLMIAACVRALGQGIQQPAVTSLVPFIVPEDKLLKINGLNSSLQSGIYLLSPLVSASLMSLASLQMLFLIDVVTAAIAICILYFLVKVPLTERQTENKEKTSHFTDLMDGLKHLKRQKYLLLLIVFSGLNTIFNRHSLCFPCR